LHPSYIERQIEWQMNTDCLGGRRAMIRAGESYVPKLTGHKNEIEYRDYLNRGSWYGALAKTATAFIGQIYRKVPIVTLAGRLQAREENITNTGDSIHTFTKNATFDVLTKGRYGMLIDVEEDAGDRTRTPIPFIAGYSAESIRNWRFRLVNGSRVLDQVILEESVDYPAPDGFGSIFKPRFRVLELDSEGYYSVRFFGNNGAGMFVQMGGAVRPPLRIGGKPIRYIPFIFMGPRNQRPEPEQPPMLAMAEANVAHWRFSVDVNAGLHKTAFPVPWIQGVDADDQHKFVISESIIWLLPAGASAEYLEFHGDGLGALERALDRTDRHMGKLGAQMLEDKKKATETAEALNTRSSGETASLADIAMSCSEAYTNALRIMATLVDEDPEKFQCTLNTDFEAGGMTSQDLLGLVTAKREGLLTMEDYAWNLMRGELVQPGRSLEELVDALEKEKPMLIGLPGTATATGQTAAGQTVGGAGKPNASPGANKPMMRQPGGVQTGVKAPRRDNQRG
jgi:hypothetical protein